MTMTSVIMYHVAIIGAGISGLTTAYTIQQTLQSKVSVTIFAKDFSPNTTGDVAAGVLTPYLWDDMVEEDAVKWTRATEKFCHKLWVDGYAKEAGISLIPMLKVTSSNEPLEVPELFKSTFGCVRVSKDHLQSINKSHNKNYIDGVHYVTFACEPAKLLPFLQERILHNGGILKRQTIESFTELVDFDVIINCTGLGSFELAEDQNVHPIRGQVTRVNAPWQYYGILSDGKYILPNINSIVCGGTEQVGDSNLSVSKPDKKSILESCYGLVPSLKNAPLVMDKVGLRPGRNKVRVELEAKACENGTLKIIHNYGHCGNGVTLSAGCAEEVVELLKVALKLNNSKL